MHGTKFKVGDKVSVTIKKSLVSNTSQKGDTVLEGVIDKIFLTGYLSISLPGYEKSLITSDCRVHTL